MIEFQYFDGCPNAAETLRNLVEVLAEEGIEQDLKETKILDISEAEKLNFQGSPTVLFNGIDIYTENEPVSYSYTCRMYVIEGIRTGVLPKNFIIDQIKKMSKKNAE